MSASVNSRKIENLSWWNSSHNLFMLSGITGLHATWTKLFSLVRVWKTKVLALGLNWKAENVEQAGKWNDLIESFKAA